DAERLEDDESLKMLQGLKKLPDQSAITGLPRKAAPMEKMSVPGCPKYLNAAHRSACAHAVAHFH
ncbi:MAG: hypothetical protein JW713_12480, partial [Pontiellaceae bacterium]|nr:hypothetical protein [Pontiellaceae bacterium]